jgi:hypothetical protein
MTSESETPKPIAGSSVSPITGIPEPVKPKDMDLSDKVLNPQIVGHPQHRDETELEKWARHSYDTAQKTLDEHGNRVMLWVSLALLLVAAVIFYTRSNAAGKNAAWQSLLAAEDPASYSSVAEVNSDSIVGAWAQLMDGEMRLSRSSFMMFQNREEANSELDAAKKSFTAALDHPHADKIIKARAQLGLAVLDEATAKGDVNTAIASYEKIVKDNADPTVSQIAKNRVEELKSSTGDANAFYAWFATQDPKPPVREEPKDTKSTVPEIPGLNMDGNVKKDEELTPEFLKSLRDAKPKASNAPDGPDDLNAPVIDFKPSEQAPAEMPKPEVKPEVKPTEAPPTTTPPVKAPPITTPPATTPPAENSPATTPENK